MISANPSGIRESRTINLRSSIKKLGILQPIMVRRKSDGYEVIFGDGRLAAAKAEGRKTIPCFVRECNDNDALLLHLTENLARENLTPLEEAKAYELLQNRFKWSIRDIAEFLGHRKEKSVIATRIKLTKLPDDVKEAVKSGKLTVSHVELIQKKVPSKFLEDEAKYVADQELSLEETEAYLTSQDPIYKIHETQNEEPENKHAIGSAKREPPVSFFKLHESRIRGRVESDFKLENLELTTGQGKRIQLSQEIREALRKVSVGDEVEVVVTLWAAPKPTPIGVS
jgi:ParB family chromosome partitioning protein